jgi:hypothetical protein
MAVPIITASVANAAALTQVEVRFNRMKINEFTSGTVCAKPATAATEASVQVTFPTGYNLSATAADYATSVTDLAWPSGAQPWVTIGSTATVSGQTVTWTSGELAVGTLYCFNWTNTTSAVQVKSSATASNTGTVVTRTSTPTNIDTGSYSTASIANDEIVVSASVPSVFSFALSGVTDALGTLSSSSVTTSNPTPLTATVNTNATNGWQVWAKDLNTGLTSATASSTIASRTPGTNSTLTAGANGYNTGITSTITSGGAITVAAAFDGTAAYQGGGLDTTLRTLATGAGVADTAVLTIKNNVSISPTQAPATDYTDTITIVGAGLF